MTTRWLPTPPTDDLTKYVAITGLWLTLGFSAILLFVVYNSYQLKDRTGLVIQMASTLHLKENVDLRIANLKSGNIHEHALSFTSKMKPKEELKFLTHFQSTLNNAMTDLKQEANMDSSQQMSTMLRKGYFYLWPPVAFVASLLMAAFGFRAWRKKQKLVDEMFEIELKLRRYELKFLGLDAEERR